MIAARSLGGFFVGFWMAADGYICGFFCMPIGFLRGARYA
jgi:hypothetical protein|nr:MAG TPA: protein of unknown function (DUF4212) [Caudoviricetes sp.]DAX37365.1 MAG TPA: protein of unknown function (DUF4212) [Caudoviricetes sp.]DAY00616.1 MAG TPA: protein of unknown function (DUF4212) [Caudoviricetes sp.]